MTSQEFKLRNYYRFFWVSGGIRAPLNLYTNKFSVQSSSLFCDTGCLNFQAFTWHSILAAWKLLCGLKTLWILGDFATYTVNIPCLRIHFCVNQYNFNLDEFLKRKIHALVGKLKNRCFCWFLGAIFLPLKGTQTCHLHTKLYKFG